MVERQTDAGRVVGRTIFDRSANPHTKRWAAVGVPLIVGLGVIAALRHHWDELFFPAAYVIVVGFFYLRPATVVTAEGIRRPWRTPAFVPWDQIEAVHRPEPYKYGLLLALAGDRQVRLDDLGNADATRVAAIGGRQPQPPTPTVLPTRPASPPKPPSDTDRAVDVQRRAAALAADRERLAAESKRLRPGDDPP